MECGKKKRLVLVLTEYTETCLKIDYNNTSVLLQTKALITADYF